METQEVELTLACTKCHEEKSDDEFPKDSRKKNRRFRHCRCRSCANKYSAKYYSVPENREKKALLDIVRRSQPKQKERRRELQRIRRYGVCDDVFGQLLTGQNMQCAICEREIDFATGCVDHCHKRGYIRGLLCLQCNAGIGSLMDNPDILRKAIAYLEKHNGHPRTEPGILSQIPCFQKGEEAARSAEPCEA